ncbi:MAG: branched-chain amino acid ABC transporter substrate-binding protein [Alphaproteobacteria bacterium]|nr:branched-chain amino acid ABC transporter substrate-binding protein [Alphaproteobacteria bacterium]
MKATHLALAMGAVLAATSAHGQDLVIGAAAPLSGPQAVFGASWHNGIKIYFDEVNAAGGVKGRKVVLSQGDDKADPREGTLVAQRFCDNKAVVAVIGHFNSGVTIPSMDVYSDCGMPQVTLSSNPRITTLNFKQIFRPIANDLRQGGLPAEYAAKTLNAKAAAIVHDKQAFGQGVSEVFSAEFTKHGGKITSVSGVDPKDVDFTPLVTKLKTENVDVVYFGGVMPQIALMLKQMREQKLTAAFFTADGGYDTSFIDQAGEANAQGALVSFQSPPYDSSPALKSFADKYQKAFGQAPGPYSAYGYMMGAIVVEAMKAASALERKPIIDALRGTKMNTMLGPVEFDDKGEIKTAPIFLYRVKGKDFELVHKSG